MKVATDALTKKGYSGFLKGGRYNFSTRDPYVRQLKEKSARQRAELAWQRAEREGNAWLAGAHGTQESSLWQDDRAVVTIPLETRGVPSTNINVFLARERTTGAWQADMYRFDGNAVIVHSIMGDYVEIDNTCYKPMDVLPH